METAKIGTPASASGAASEARTPVSECSSVPATRIARHGPEDSPSGGASAAALTIDISWGVLTTAKGSPATSAPGGKRRTASSPASN